MLDIKLKFDTKELRRRIEESKPAIHRDIQRAVHRASLEGMRRAKQGEFKDQTGNLRSGITVDVIGWSGDRYICEIRTNSPYAQFVEEPTKPHWIYPKAGYDANPGSLMPGQTRRGRGPGPHEYVVGRGRALRWKDEGGDVHFARRVYHPGTAGFHFMSRAGDWARIKLIQELHGGFVNLHSVWTR